MYIYCNSTFLEATPPTNVELGLPNNDNDPAILSWTKPELTDDNREFFQGFYVSFSRTVLQIALNQRRKRNTLTYDSQTIRLEPDVTSYTYDESCPYSDGLTLCPYSQYCFSVVSVYEFRGTLIDVSDSTLITICTNTSEAGEFMIICKCSVF